MLQFARSSAVTDRRYSSLLARHRILDRDLIVQHVGRDESYPFCDAHLIAVGYPLVLHRFLDADRVDDQGVSLPAADGAAIITRRHFIDLCLRSVEVDAAHFAE